MIRQLLRKLGSALVAAGTPGERTTAPAEAPAFTRTKAHNRFDRSGRTLLAGRKDATAPVLAGAVQLFGMREIRVALGDAWPTVATRAYGVTERVLRHYLTEADLYTRRDDETYVLCFAELGKAEAERTTRRIVEDTKAALRREVPEASGIRVGRRLAEVDAADMAGALQTGGSLLDAIMASLETVRDEAAEAYERQRRTLLDEASVVYNPVWSPKNESIVMYRCLLDDVTSRATLQNLQAIADAETLQQAIADLDYLILGRAIRNLHGLLQSQNKAVFLVPIHFQTLNQKARRDAYLALCQKMPRPYMKFVFFEIYGIPASAPLSRLLQITDMVQPHGNSVVMALPTIEERTVFEMAKCGIYGLSVDLAELNGQEAGVLTKYNQLARTAGVRSFVHGARTIGQLKDAAEAGSSYIDGDAVAPKTDAPKGLYHWKLLDVSPTPDLAQHLRPDAATSGLRKLHAMAAVAVACALCLRWALLA